MDENERRGRPMDLEELMDLEDTITKQIAFSTEETAARLSIFRNALFDAYNAGAALVYENDDDFEADWEGEDLEYETLEITDNGGEGDPESPAAAGDA